MSSLNSRGLVAASVLSVLAACGSNPAPAPVSISGTVSGLKAEGLVLVNGTDSLEVQATATRFTMPTFVAQGSKYALVVEAQPTGQTCSIANGVGTTSSANISNAVVTCAAQAAQITGSVASSPADGAAMGDINGLQAAGLKLTDDTDTITVSAGASGFAFPTPIAVGSSYAVQVAAQPAGETCAVVGGSGVMPASELVTVTVNCTDQPETLGGSITGLKTAGLVLSDGTESVTPTAGDKDFTFPTPLAVGQFYQVQVATQPANATCSVFSSAGVMGTTGSSTAEVVCSPAAYTLSGSISGLTDAGLVLSDGTEALSVGQGAGSFAFPTPVAFGSSYAVSVQTQPQNETCTVSSGSGVMPGSNVATIAVTCSPTSYALGGSISGDAVSGLQLTDGTDTVTVAANAAVFSFPTALAVDSAYAVSVATQPSGEACSVFYGGGTVSSASASAVSVQCSPTSYTLGGTITGMTVGGLELANVSDTLYPAASDSTFTFSGPLSFGTSYDVVVAAQPAGETCSVSNATGTAAANVSNVAVTCSPDSYAAQVNYSNLSTYGLVLSDGFNQVQVTPASIGQVIFPADMVEGAAYAITVVSQPAGGSCGFTSGGSGTVPAMSPGNVVSAGSLNCNITGTAISATISGLNAAGLVLSDGVDQVTVTLGEPGVSFLVTGGNTYNITVVSQPVGQTCTVSSGSGLLPGFTATVTCT